MPFVSKVHPLWTTNVFTKFIRYTRDLTLDGTKPVVPFFEKDGLLTSALETQS